MPIERQNAVLDLSDPNIILGPHKCHATEHLENSDPLAAKKKQSDKVSPQSLGNVGDAGTTDSSAEETTGTPDVAAAAQAITIEDGDKGVTTDEDDNTELGACAMQCVLLYRFTYSAGQQKTTIFF